MNADTNSDWRFSEFRDTSGAYNRTLAIDTPSSRAQFTAASRISPSASPARTVIPSPSNTNWNSTFLNNQPSSPSRTDWQKQFGTPSSERGISFAPNSAIRTPSSPFSFDLSPATDRSGLGLTNPPSSTLNPPSSFFASRLTDADLTSRDHELYGAGNDLGWNY